MSGLAIAMIVTGSILTYLVGAGATAWYVESDKEWLRAEDAFWVALFWPMGLLFIIPASVYGWLESRSTRRIGK